MSLQLIFYFNFMWCDDKYNVRYFWHRWRRIDGTYSLHLIPTVPFTNDCCYIIDDCNGVILY